MSAPPLIEFTLLAYGSLFVIVDPIATVPVFLAMTPRDTPEHRIHTARLATIVMAAVLLVFAVAGNFIFKMLGITMPAFQIAASIVLLIVALDMLRAQRSRVIETSEETSAGTEKSDVAITPLAVPMLAGPGSISTVIVMQSRATDLAQHAALFGCIGAVSLTTYWIFHVSANGAKWLNPIAMKVTTRIMGLLLAAVAVQFMINGVKAVRAGWLQP